MCEGLKERSFVVIDLETTGLKPESSKIIEIGAIKVLKGEVVSSFQSMICPGIQLSEKVKELTGIEDEMLQDKPQWEEVSGQLYQFLSDLPLLGHNINFDYRFLKTHFAKVKLTYEAKLIDTLEIARKLHRDLTSKSLSSMCEYYNIKNEHAHRAYDDARATFELYVKMLENAPKVSNNLFCEKKYFYKVKKDNVITNKQKNYLLDLIKYHKINTVIDVGKLTKSEASRMIDHIILQYGRKI